MYQPLLFQTLLTHPSSLPGPSSLTYKNAEGVEEVEGVVGAEAEGLAGEGEAAVVGEDPRVVEGLREAGEAQVRLVPALQGMYLFIQNSFCQALLNPDIC